MTLKITTKSLSRFYSVLLAWTPIIGIYRSFIPGISMAELLLILCVSLSVVLRQTKHQTYLFAEQIMLLFTVYSFFITLVSLLIGSWFEMGWFQRVLRFIFYIFCILYSSKELFDKNIFFQHVNIMSCVLLLGIIFQYFAYYGAGRYIRLYGNILPVMTEELLSINYERIFSYSVFRPSSFLTEPSHIAQNAMLPFIYDLYKSTQLKQNKYTFMSVLVGVTVLLSKSLWGYFLIMMVFVLWFIDSMKKRHLTRRFIIVPIIIGLSVFFVLKSSLWSDTFSRLDIYNLQDSIAFTGRFYGYEDYFQLPFYRILFGSGFGAVIYKQITNSILFILVGEGIVGLILVIMMMSGAYKSVAEEWKKTLCIVFCFLLFGSNIFFSLGMVRIFSLIFEKPTLSDNNKSQIY